MFFGKLFQFFGCGTGAGLQADVYRRQFPGVGIGLTDCRHELNRGMAGEGVFDYAGIDIVSAADNDVLGPPGQPEVSVFVLSCEVAGVEPAIFIQHFAGGIFVLVAGKHIGPPDQQISDFIGPRRRE